MTTPQPRPDWDDSIDLRKWVDALIRYKFLIVGILVAAVGVATVFSYLVQTPRFESKAGAVLPGPWLLQDGLPEVVLGSRQGDKRLGALSEARERDSLGTVAECDQVVMIGGCLRRLPSVWP